MLASRVTDENMWESGFVQLFVTPGGVQVDLTSSANYAGSLTCSGAGRILSYVVFDLISLS